MDETIDLFKFYTNIMRILYFSLFCVRCFICRNLFGLAICSNQFLFHVLIKQMVDILISGGVNTIRNDNFN